MKLTKLTRGAAAISAFTLASFAFIYFVPLSAFSRDGAQLGAAIASANALLCLAALSWCYLKSDKVFFSAFYGGMLWKLSVLGATVFLLARAGSSAIVSMLLALAVMTVILNIIELFYLPVPVEWISKKS